MRRIKKAQIKAITLCPRGANQLPVLYKSEDGAVEFQTLIKDDNLDELGELLAVVYSPETRDVQGDIASAVVIKEMAYDFMRNGEGIDIKHDGKMLTKEQVFIAENFIIAKGDARFSDMKDYSGNPVDVTGGWGIVMKIDDPALRKLYKEGGWNGVSMFGPALMESESVSKSTTVLEELLKHIQKTTNNEDIDMDKKEVQELVKEAVKSSIEEFTKTLAKDEPKDEPKELTFEGDPSSIEDLKKHMEAIKLSKLDLSDPKALAAHIASLEKVESKDDEDEEDEDVDESEETVSLRKELKAITTKLEKAEKASGQSREKKTKASEEFDDTLSKEDQDRFAVGKEMAAAINKSRGYSS